MSVTFCGLELAHRVINGSGTFDVIAARKAFGPALEAEFSFAAYVSKTITREPRAGNAPPRLATAHPKQAPKPHAIGASSASWAGVERSAQSERTASSIGAGPQA